jgi:ferritin-like metal-binding protein YciE
MKNLSNLKDVLVYLLKGMYDAEKKLQKTLPRFIKRTTSGLLKDELEKYLENAEKRINQLDLVFEDMGEKPGARINKIVGDLLTETEELLLHAPNDDVRDAILIGSVQNIHHLKISGYGTAAAFSDELGKQKVTNILREILELEKETDRTLSRLAVETINEQAHELHVL